MLQRSLIFLLFFNIFTIVLSEETKTTVGSDYGINIKTYTIWKNATVPFYVNPSHFDHEQTLAILSALSMFAFKTCLKFKPVMARPFPTDEVMVFINPDGEKRCYIDSRGHSVFNPHFVKLGYDCLKSPQIDMMIMRALGFPFEHNRDNRDIYIEVLNENIEPGNVELFTKQEIIPLDLRFLPYDVNSVMHFGNRDYSKNGHRTILFKDPSTVQNRVGLTDHDLRKIEIVYGPSCTARDRKEKLELCQSYPGVARRKRQTDDNTLEDKPFKRVKRDVDETEAATKSLRVNPDITPPPNQTEVITQTLKDLGIDEAVQEIVEQVYKVSAIALKNARVKYCNDTNKEVPTKIARTGDFKTNNSDILGIIEVVTDFAKGMIDHALQNLTSFCEVSGELEMYQRFCDFSGRDPRCRNTYRSTKSGPVKARTQHRPIMSFSTGHNGGAKKRLNYGRAGTGQEEEEEITTQSIRRKRDAEETTTKSELTNEPTTNVPNDIITAEAVPKATEKENDKENLPNNTEKSTENTLKAADAKEKPDQKTAVNKQRTNNDTMVQPTAVNEKSTAVHEKSPKDPVKAKQKTLKGKAKTIKGNTKRANNKSRALRGGNKKGKATKGKATKLKGKGKGGHKKGNVTVTNVKAKDNKLMVNKEVLRMGTMIPGPRRNRYRRRSRQHSGSRETSEVLDNLDAMLAKKIKKKKHIIQKTDRKEKKRYRDVEKLTGKKKRVRNDRDLMAIPIEAYVKDETMMNGDFSHVNSGIHREKNKEEVVMPPIKKRGTTKRDQYVERRPKTDNTRDETEDEYEDRSGPVHRRPEEKIRGRNLPRTVTLSKKNKEFYKERRWPKGELYYMIQVDTTYDLDDMRQRLQEVGDILKEKTCVRLIEIQPEDEERYEDFIFIDNSPDYVTGRVGGKQKFGSIELFRGGQHRQHAAMMVMAMLGFYFEVSRHDRDKHIRVHMRHVRPDKLHHFEMIRSDATIPLPYDYASATHPAWQFWRQVGRTGISSVATFKEKDPDGSIMKSLGQHEKLLSDLDIVKINSVYGIRCFRKERAKHSNIANARRNMQDANAPVHRLAEY